jgi:hypothetical protein
MPTPMRLEEFSYREFHVVLARIGSQVRAVARDREGNQVENIIDGTAEEARAEIKRRLNHLSQNFVSVEGAINLFRKAFPKGFTSDFYQFYERDYKKRSIVFMSDKLAKDPLNDLLASGDYETVCQLAKQALSTSNLVFPNEQMALSDALKVKGTARPFAESLRELIYGDLETALEDLSHLLRRHGAAKWPILTFWPFFRFPDRHMFLKPTFTQSCAERMGFDLHYQTLPNGRTYRSLLEFTEFLRRGIESLAPRDNIDLQAFIYAVGKEGYIREAAKKRKEWELTK